MAGFLISAICPPLPPLPRRCALPSKLVPLHGLALCCCCLLPQACLPSRFCFWLLLPPCLLHLFSFMISRLAAAAALFSTRVSLHDFTFDCLCRLVSQARLPSRFRSSLLPLCLPRTSPSPFCSYLRGCRLVTQPCDFAAFLCFPASEMLFGVCDGVLVCFVVSLQGRRRR